MAKKARYGKRIFLSIAVLILLVAGFLLWPEIHESWDGFWKSDQQEVQDPNSGLPDSPAPLPEPDPPVDITIAAVGDILIHNTVYFAAYQPASQTYDFSSQFKYVKPYLKDADITVANLETTLAGAEAGYSGYPQFNTPDAIIDALKDSGVDIVTAANNHRMDKGIPGFYRTIQVVREKGLDIIGVKAEDPEKSYTLKEIKGVRVAFLNFGYAYPLQNGGLDINGLILPVDMAGLMDTFDPRSLEKSVEAVSAKITAAKNDGAEVIVAFLHWGDEYHRTPNEFQQKLAAEMASQGVDVIFGGHPHVLQPAEFIPGADGRKVPVFYSLGNFISDQRKETVDDIYTEQGMIAKVTIRVEKGKPPVISAAEALPTWVNKKTIDGRFVYEIIPAPDAIKSLPDFPLLRTGDQERIRFCYDTVKDLTKGLSAGLAAN